MDRDGIDLQVISATPVLFAYERPAEHALDCARLFNDAALELCSRGNGRLKSLCQVPLQDIEAACKEITRCKHAGHVGVQIGNHVGEKNLDDPGIITFLHHCADERMPVLVHPWDMLGQAANAELHDALDSRDARRNATRDCGDDSGRGIRQTAHDFANLLCTWRWKFRVPPRALAECMAASSGGAWRLRVVPAQLSEPVLCRFGCVRSARTRVSRGHDGSGACDAGLGLSVPIGRTPRGRAGSIQPPEFTGKEQILGRNAVEFLGLETQDKPVAQSEKERRQTTLKPATYLQFVPKSSGTARSCSIRNPRRNITTRCCSSSCIRLTNCGSKNCFTIWMPLWRICEMPGANPHSRDEVYEAARLLRRCTEITRILVEQFTILETMLPTHFLAFRGKLEPASGFQSEQFRELEFLCGLKDEKMLRYHRPTPEAYAQLERRLSEPSLHDVFFEALRAMGKLQVDNSATNASDSMLGRTQYCRCTATSTAIGTGLTSASG